MNTAQKISQTHRNGKPHSSLSCQKTKCPACWKAVLASTRIPQTAWKKIWWDNIIYVLYVISHYIFLGYNTDSNVYLTMTCICFSTSWTPTLLTWESGMWFTISMHLRKFSSFVHFRQRSSYIRTSTSLHLFMMNFFSCQAMIFSREWSCSSRYNFG